MSLNFLDNPFKEKIQLIIRLIDCYINKSISSDEIYYILDLFLSFDISKDKNFEGTNILEDIKNVINIELAFYTSNKKDLESEPDLFGEDKLKQVLIKLKEKLKKSI